METRRRATIGGGSGKAPPPPPPRVNHSGSPPPPPPPPAKGGVGIATSRRGSDFLSYSYSESTTPTKCEQARMENFDRPRLLQHFCIDDNESLSNRVAKVYEGLSNSSNTFTDCCGEIEKKTILFDEICRHVSARIRREYLNEVSEGSKSLHDIELGLREKYPTCDRHISGVIHQSIYQKLKSEELTTSWLKAWSTLETLKKVYSEDTIRSYFSHMQSIDNNILNGLSIEDNANLCIEALEICFEQASQGKSDKAIKDFLMSRKHLMHKVDEHVIDRVATEYAHLFDDGETRASIESKLRAKYQSSKFEGILVKARYRAHMKEHFTYKSKLSFNHDVEAERKKICTEPSKCSHPYHHFWEGVFICWDCWEKLNDTPEKEQKYAKILSIERERMSGIENDSIPEHFSKEERQSYIGELSASRGIKIGFFEALVDKYDLWDCNTHDLIRLVVKPMTERSRCRFVELPEMAEHTGPAHTFCTYAQKGKLGDVVAAFRDGNSDPDRCIWFDAFCVRQWPCVCPDLDFKSTIEHCKSFLAVCSSLKEVEDLCRTDVLNHLNDGSSIKLSFDAKCRICFLRVWCLVEAHQACLMPDMPYIMKCGHYCIRDGMTKFDVNLTMLRNLSVFVDIENAEASVPSDKERILEDIRNDPKVTVDALNKRIKMAISAAEENFYDGHSIIASAACGDQRALEVVLMDPEATIHAAFCGFKVLLEKLLEQSNCDLSLKDSDGRTALICAAMHGHSECARVILEKDKSCIHDMHDDQTVLMKAVFPEGHPECLEVLLKYVKDVDESIIHKTDPHHEDDTAIDLALHVHHDDCVKILRKYGAEVSDHHSHRHYSLDDDDCVEEESDSFHHSNFVQKSLNSTW